MIADVNPSELPVVLSTHAPFFRKSDHKDFEWALAPPDEDLFPADPAQPLRPLRHPDAQGGRRAIQGPVHVQHLHRCEEAACPFKERKVEGDASGTEDAGAEDGEVEQPAGEEILAQVPLPLPEPEEIPVPRLTRARRV